MAHYEAFSWPDRSLSVFSLGLLLCLPACKTPPPAQAPSASTPFHPAKLAEMDAVIHRAIEDKKCPGGVLWLEHRGASYHKAYGNRSLVPTVEPMTEDTLFDAASLTKVIACTPAVMLLVERGQVELDERVQTYIPEFSGDGKEAITVRQLMLHLSGLRGDIETKTDWHGTANRHSEGVRREAAQRSRHRLPIQRHQLLPAGRNRAARQPSAAGGVRRPRDLSAVEDDRHRLYATQCQAAAYRPHRGGERHTLSRCGARSTARHMGGVAGHAGLFTTAPDLARYARMLLNLGSLDGVRIFKPETVELMTSVQSPPSISARRGLGWDIDSGYSGPRGKLFPLGSYGHTGWTGTSIWIDPFSQTFVIFLSNRNHPDESGNVGPLRARLGTLAAEAIRDFNFAYVPGALSAAPEQEPGPAVQQGEAKPARLKSLNGIDVLEREKFARLKGLRVGLITNHTGEDRDRNPTIDLLKRAPRVELKALFSPEHGIRGAADEGVGDSVDQKTGLPVYSLYGDRSKPTTEQLKDLDALVFDIQDIGCRFYTYTATMGLTLEAAGENGKKYFVLDRVNPINAATVDGPVRMGKESFVAFHEVPLRYGMTIGELARMCNAERNCKADLTVIQVRELAARGLARPNRAALDQPFPQHAEPSRGDPLSRRRSAGKRALSRARHGHAVRGGWRALH